MGHTALMRSPLAAIAARAGLSVEDDTGPERVICSYAARWPGVGFTVAAEAELLETALAVAAAEVPDLWPGRAAEDGALSLLAIALQGVLDVRRDPAATAVLAPSGQWVAEPAEGPPPQPGADPAELEWRAERT
jgi:hypothetical protein